MDRNTDLCIGREYKYRRKYLLLRLLALPDGYPGLAVNSQTSCDRDISLDDFRHIRH